MPFPFPVGHWELLALALVIVLLFGPKRLPGIARTLGQSVREVRTPFGEARRLLELDDAPERAALPPAQTVVPPAAAPAPPPRDRAET